MSSILLRRKEFRNYLDECGVVSALGKALIALYDENPKPDDPVQFVRLQMGDLPIKSGASDEIMKELEENKNKIAKLEEELKIAKNLNQQKQVGANQENCFDDKDVPMKIHEPEIDNKDESVKIEEPEIDNRILKESEIVTEEKDTVNEISKDTNLEQVEESTKENDEHKEKDNVFISNLENIIPREVIDELIPLKTSLEFTLQDCIISDTDKPISYEEVFAADGECYKVFEPFFASIIKGYHFENKDYPDKIQQSDSDWGDASSFEELDSDKLFIKTIKMTVSRNLQEYPFITKMSDIHFGETLEKIKSSSKCLESTIPGELVLFNELEDERKQQLENEGFLFNGQFNNFWPNGRAIYLSESRNFWIQVNNKDHVEIISVGHDGHIGETYERLFTAIEIVEQNLNFQKDDSFGYLTCSPTNIGTGLKIWVQISLPKLSSNSEQIKDIIGKYGLKFSQLQKEDAMIEIWNTRTIGISEYFLVKNVHNCIEELLKIEIEME